MMKFIHETDLNEETFKQFVEEVEQVRATLNKQPILEHHDTPVFSSIEEWRAYNGSISFMEWKNKVKERYDL